MEFLKSYFETYCPSCKMKILSHANKCPYCLYDFTTPQHQQHILWQKKIFRYWLCFCIFISSVALVSDSVSTALLTFLISLVIGFFVIKQIKKTYNFFK